MRKIGKSRRSITGTLTSPKAGGGAEYESALERDHYLMLEFYPEVARIVPQPLVITYTDAQGKPRRYTPDTLVSYHGDRPPALFEVKYVQELRDNGQAFAERFRAARTYARTQGWTSTVLTERTVRAPSLATAQFLRPFLRRTFSDALEAEVLHALECLGETTPAGVLTAFPAERKGELLPVLWKLVAARRIAADLSGPFGVTSRVRPREQA